MGIPLDPGRYTSSGTERTRASGEGRTAARCSCWRGAGRSGAAIGWTSSSSLTGGASMPAVGGGDSRTAPAARAGRAGDSWACQLSPGAACEPPRWSSGRYEVHAAGSDESDQQPHRRVLDPTSARRFGGDDSFALPDPRASRRKHSTRYQWRWLPVRTSWSHPPCRPSSGQLPPPAAQVGILWEGATESVRDRS